MFIADDLPAKRLQRLYSANHYIVSTVDPIAIPFLKKDGERSALASALGTLGIGVGRELLNFYRGMVKSAARPGPTFQFVDEQYSLPDGSGVQW